LLSLSLVGCTLQTRPITGHTDDSAATAALDASAPDSDSDASAAVRELDASADSATVTASAPRVDAGSAAPRSGNAAPPPATASNSSNVTPSSDAGAPGASQPAKRDAAAAPAADAGRADVTPIKGCTRDALRDRAAAYLTAMASGDTTSLQLHPAVRYTENGQQQMLGLGLWLTHPKAEFARHVLDAVSCSTVTEAVLNDLQGRKVFGVRLRYVDEQLLEIEAQVVPKNTSYYDPDGLIASDPDPWLAPVTPQSRDAMMRLADNYFDSSTDASLLPPSAPTCKRRQNGQLMGDNGSCNIPAGVDSFRQRRYPVIDEPNGIVTAIVLYRTFIGMYLFKIQGDTIQIIDVIGGANTAMSGW
jgi:hypothetical protein